MLGDEEHLMPLSHHSFLFLKDMFAFSSFTEAHVGVSTRKTGNSEPKEVNTSSFTQSPAGMQPTSLEQVQTLLTNKQK